MGRPDFSAPGTQGSGQTVAVNQRPELTKFKEQTTTTVAAGSSETVEVYAPTGAIWQMVLMDLYTPGNSTASSGDHEIEAGYGGNVKATLGRSNYNETLDWKYAYWLNATKVAHPSNEAAQQASVSSLKADENVPMRFTYRNQTDADHTDDRFYIGQVEEVSY